MAQAQPPHLTYQSNTYLTLSAINPSAIPTHSTAAGPSTSSSQNDSDPEDSPTSHSHSQSASNASSFDSLRSSLQYVGPVGALRDSHIFSVPVPTSNPPPPGVEEVKEWLEGRKGVSNVEVMQPKKRAGRRFEG